MGQDMRYWIEEMKERELDLLRKLHEAVKKSPPHNLDVKAALRKLDEHRKLVLGKS